MTLRDHIARALQDYGLTAYAKRATVAEAAEKGELVTALTLACKAWLKEQEERDGTV